MGRDLDVDRADDQQLDQHPCWAEAAALGVDDGWTIDGSPPAALAETAEILGDQPIEAADDVDDGWALEGVSYLNAAVVFAALGVTSYFFREASETTERRVADLANTDPLTQLPNRRRLWDLLENEVLRAERSGRSFIIALADIDHFKKFNDSHGHHCGDAVLRHVAGVMRGSLRRTIEIAS